MASERGESTAFYMCIRRKSQGACVYDPSSLKTSQIRKRYFTIEEPSRFFSTTTQNSLRIRSVKKNCLANIRKAAVSHNKRPAFHNTAFSLLTTFEQKAVWLTGFLRRNEWINGCGEEGWFNSYYDNSGRLSRASSRMASV